MYVFPEPLECGRSLLSGLGSYGTRRRPGFRQRLSRCCRRNDDRRTRNTSASIDAMYAGINVDQLFNEYFLINEMHVSPPKQKSIFRPPEGVADRNLFEQEFLNSLDFSGILPHKIVLKVGTTIIMIRNLNSDTRLCN
ncbi:LOW QUALITY PROTEIN: Helitron helicase [Phytophthora megakarya]|uniref:Helitron helicase n=1 Tax=Phytophthora megakarya TaxID=4795 RepID=A0A225VCS0_9STRA|nr:LOW QUALITY PROTEIN: Helitron helicase [Phytophthora megakarya]